MRPSKLIISRKGFDSVAGGCPSPIFPDGTIYSLPIPGGDDEVPIHYADIQHGNINLGTVVEGLTHGRHDGESLLGLDPDVRRDAFCRDDEWRGLFGQTGASQTHLEGQGVGAGDVFLFFGLFRPVEETSAGWHFLRKGPQQHILWGWLQIEQACKVDEIRDDPGFYWATYHCHFGWHDDPRNTLYVATQRLDLGEAPKAPGSGVFPSFHRRLVLTKPGSPVSNWRLPRWFYPNGSRKPLTYHPDPARWQRDGEYAYLRSVGRGQEFVLDLEDYPEGIGWLSSLVCDLGEK